MSYDDYLVYKEHQYNRELEKYEQAKEQQQKLKASIQEAKQWASKGLSKKKNDNDKLSANFSKERTKKTASKASKLTKELEKIEIDTSFRKKEKIDFSVDFADSKGNRDIYATDLVSRKIPFLGRKIKGESELLIHNGQIMRKVMRKNRLSEHEVENLMRQNGAFKLEDVKVGILERNGKLSILKD